MAMGAGGNATPRCGKGGRMSDDIKATALVLLRDAYEEECLHLELRIIRDTQEPRFEALANELPAIYADFMKARDVHDRLRDIRHKRIKVLITIIEE